MALMLCESAWHQHVPSINPQAMSTARQSSQHKEADFWRLLKLVVRSLCDDDGDDGDRDRGNDGDKDVNGNRDKDRCKNGIGMRILMKFVVKAMVMIL